MKKSVFLFLLCISLNAEALRECNSIDECVSFAKQEKEDLKKLHAYAYKMYDKSCKLGELLSCFSKAKFLENGYGVDRNTKLANEIFKDICGNKDVLEERLKELKKTCSVFSNKSYCFVVGSMAKKCGVKNPEIKPEVFFSMECDKNPDFFMRKSFSCGELKNKKEQK